MREDIYAQLMTRDDDDGDVEDYVSGGRLEK